MAFTVKVHGGGAPSKQTTMEAEIVIADGQKLSDLTLPGGYARGTFQIPGAFTGASIQPQMSNDGTNFTTVGSTIAVSTNGTYAIPDDCFKAKYLRLDSASNETADRTLLLFLKS